jgi:hypothetical protein
LFWKGTLISAATGFWSSFASAAWSDSAASPAAGATGMTID